MNDLLLQALADAGLPPELPALQALYDHPGRPALDLAATLTDAARGGGRQVRVAWRGHRPVGCLGWVSLGLLEDGRLYGAPVLAADAEVAALLLAELQRQGRSLGASHLRVSTWAGDEAKAQALGMAGYRRLFEWVNFVRALAADGPGVAARPLPQGLARVAFDRIDWPRAAALNAECFRDVPNSPAVSAGLLAEEWAEADWSASRLLQDGSGRYQAFVIVSQTAAVEAVGVAAAWRGRGLADALYAEAAAAVRRRGGLHLHALVASSNLASMRLHQRLGFTEPQPRGAVWELALADAPLVPPAPLSTGP